MQLQASQDMANTIAENLDNSLGNTSIVYFSDGEFEPSFDETVRGCHVFIVQSTPPPSDNLMELLLMIDAAKRASAHKICSCNAVTLVMRVKTKKVNQEFR